MSPEQNKNSINARGGDINSTQSFGRETSIDNIIGRKRDRKDVCVCVWIERERERERERMLEIISNVSMT